MSTMSTPPLITYSKFQIRSFVVSLHVAISKEPSFASYVSIFDRPILSWLIEFVPFDNFGVSTPLHICPVFSLTLWTTNVSFLTLTLGSFWVVSVVLSNLKTSISIVLRCPRNGRLVAWGFLRCPGFRQLHSFNLHKSTYLINESDCYNW